MQDTALGTRLVVSPIDSSRIIGLGTYLGTSAVIRMGGQPAQRVLLDSGVEITGYQCRWNEAPKGSPEPTPFTATLAFPLRVLESVTGSARYCLTLPRGYEMRVERLRLLNFHARDYVMAQFSHDGRLLYVPIVDIGLPLYSQLNQRAA